MLVQLVQCLIGYVHMAVLYGFNVKKMNQH